MSTALVLDAARYREDVQSSSIVVCVIVMFASGCGGGDSSPRHGETPCEELAIRACEIGCDCRSGEQCAISNITFSNVEVCEGTMVGYCGNADEADVTTCTEDLLSAVCSAQNSLDVPDTTACERALF
jgi:hypothetical protein